MELCSEPTLNPLGLEEDTASPDSPAQRAQEDTGAETAEDARSDVRYSDSSRMPKPSH